MKGVQCADASWHAVQINTALKLGVMWDHNGTYMEGFGFQYRDQQVQVKLNAEDQMTGELPACPCLYALQPAATMPCPACGNCQHCWSCATSATDCQSWL